MFKTRFASIKDLSERRRLPRLGKIRLGVKVVSPRTNREYPKETEYFIVPPEVAKVYGDRPTALEAMFPINDREVVFPQAFKWYGGQRGLKCVGNGEVALRMNEETHEMSEIACTCEHLETGECQRIAHLMVILPRINMGGVYQIDVGSYHSIIDINSGLDYVQALVGRFAMVPLRLRRAPKETHFGGQKQIHYTLQLFLDADVDLINRLREDTSRVLLSTRSLALPPPEIVDENGVMEEPEEDGIGSFEVEGEKFESERKESSPAISEGNVAGNEPLHLVEEPRITKQQIEAIKKLAERRKVKANFEFLSGISFKTASRIIAGLQKEEFDQREILGLVKQVDQ